MIHQDTNFKIYLSLYGWKENILPKQHIVHWCISVSQAREGYQAHSVTAAVGVAHTGRATGGVLPLTYHYGGECRVFNIKVHVCKQFIKHLHLSDSVGSIWST